MKRFWSTFLGNLFEHYDNALFGFLSPFLAPLIFPKQDPTTALILTFAMIPLGMAARPLGSLFFGRLGDRHGRHAALFWTLGGMGLTSLGIALTPTYAQAGLLSPILFCLGRILQNFLASGESMGGALFLLEGAPPHRHNLLSSLYNTSTIAGLLLASLAVFLFPHHFRFLYLFGSLVALFGFLIRRQSPLAATPAPIPSLKQTLLAHRKPLFRIMLAAGFAYANYTIALVLMNGFIPLITSYTKQAMLGLNTLLLIVDFSLLPLFGLLASKISRERLMLFSSLATALLAPLLLSLLPTASFPLLITIRFLLVLLGVAFFAPFHAWAKTLLPPNARYTIISLGYALGSQLLGGPTASLSLWLFHTTHAPIALSFYWIFLALLSSLSLLKPLPQVSHDHAL